MTGIAYSSAHPAADRPIEKHPTYKGSAPAMQDLLGGQVPMMFSDMIAALPHIKAGKLRPIAVGSGKRVSFTPDVKTVAEQGFPGFDAAAWGGLLAGYSMHQIFNVVRRPRAGSQH